MALLLLLRLPATAIAAALLLAATATATAGARRACGAPLPLLLFLPASGALPAAGGRGIATACAWRAGPTAVATTLLLAGARHSRARQAWTAPPPLPLLPLALLPRGPMLPLLLWMLLLLLLLLLLLWLWLLLLLIRRHPRIIWANIHLCQLSPHRLLGLNAGQ